jgi:hypothetical protein
LGASGRELLEYMTANGYTPFVIDKSTVASGKLRMTTLDSSSTTPAHVFFTRRAEEVRTLFVR